MAYLLVNRSDDGMRHEMRRNMRESGYHLGSNYPVMRESGYEQGYRMGYKHGWEDSEDDMDAMQMRRKRNSRGEFV